jgi:hypothetical protein
MSIAENVDEKGVLKIRGLIGQYGLRSFLEAVMVEIQDIISSHSYGDKVKDDPEDDDLQEAKRVFNRLDKIIGWQKETQ